jgi:hypothetical protein
LLVLLYRGLKLEIDATAVLGDDAKRVHPASDEGSCVVPGFAAACRVGDLIYIGAIGAPDEASLDGQLERSLQRMDALLGAMVQRMLGRCCIDKSDALRSLNVFFESEQRE